MVQIPNNSISVWLLSWISRSYQALVSCVPVSVSVVQLDAADTCSYTCPSEASVAAEMSLAVYGSSLIDLNLRRGSIMPTADLPEKYLFYDECRRVVRTVHGVVDGDLGYDTNTNARCSEN